MGDLHLYRKPRILPAEKSLDDIVSRNVLNALKKDPPPKQHEAKKAGDSSDADIIASMARRLSILEKELRERNLQLQRSHAENEALKSKLKVAEDEIQRRALDALGPVGDGGKDESPAMQHMRAEHARLRAQSKQAWKQVAEMKAFLNDYGMVWVGEPEPDSPGSAGASSSSAPPTGGHILGRGSPTAVGHILGRGSPTGGNGGNIVPAPGGVPPGGKVLGHGPAANGGLVGPGAPSTSSSAAAAPSASTAAAQGAGAQAPSTSAGANGHHPAAQLQQPRPPPLDRSVSDARGQDIKRRSFSGRRLSAGAVGLPSEPSSSSVHGAAGADGSRIPHAPGAPMHAVKAPAGQLPPRASVPAGRYSNSQLEPLVLPSSSVAHVGVTADIPSPTSSSTSPAGSSIPHGPQGLHGAQKAGPAVVGMPKHISPRSSVSVPTMAWGAGPPLPPTGGAAAGGAAAAHPTSSSSAAANGGAAQPHKPSNQPPQQSQPSSSAAPTPAAAPQRQPPQPSAAASSSFPPAAAPASAQLPFKMADLLASIDELNQLAGDGCGQLVPSGAPKGAGGLGGDHVLRTPDAVRIVVYQDGLQLHRNAPRPWKDPATAGALKDLLDGYFPIALKKEFPDGVPLKVVDRSNESLSVAKSGPSGGGNIRTWQDLEEHESQPMNKKDFLNKLPQSVIKNGKVIEIRSEIGKVMGGGAGGASSAAAPNKPDLVSTPVDALLTTIQRNHVGPNLPPPLREGGLKPGDEIATLQVKSEDGRQAYILKLKYDDTIGELRRCIDAHRAKLSAEDKQYRSTHYDIRTAFPARSFTDAKETLRAAELVPNATLFLRAL